MKTLKDYIKENNSQPVSTYVNEGFWDGLKSFWNWLTGNTDKNDYDRDGYYRPDIDYDTIDNKSFLFQAIKNNDKVIELYKKYFVKDNKLNKNCKEYRFDLPILDDGKKMPKNKLTSYAVVYKNTKTDKEKLIGIFTLVEYDNTIYIYKITIMDWFLYHLNNIFRVMIKDLNLEKHVAFITSHSQKYNFLEQQKYKYNNAEQMYEKTY
jgi:hypothetical protein